MIASTLRHSIPLLAAVPLFGIATGALFPLFALGLEDLNASSGFIGTVTSLYYAGSFLGAITFGMAVRFIGYRAGFAVSALLAAVASYGLTLTDDSFAWLCLRFAGGYALGAYYVVVDSWFQALGRRQTRGLLFAVYETVRLAATALGPFLLVVGAVQTSMLLVSAAYLLSILPALLNRPPEQSKIAAFSFSGVVDIARCFPFALLIAFSGGMANASFYGLSAIYAADIGIDRIGIAFFVSFVLLAPAVSEIPLGALADRLRRMPVACACGAVACIASMAIVSLGAPTLLIACLLAALVGGCMVPMYAFGLSRVVDTVEDGHAIQAATAGLFAYNLGAFVGPALAGAAMEMMGPVGLYVFLGTVAAAAAIAAVADTVFSATCCPERPAQA